MRWIVLLRAGAFLVSGTVVGLEYVSKLLTSLRRRPEVVRVVLVGIVGLFLSWVTYEIVFFLVRFEPRATISWFIAYILGIFRQHHLHRLISFPNPPVRYRISLARDYISGGVLLALSTALNWILNELFDMNYQVVWLICTAFVGLSDYLAMKRFVFRRLKSSAKNSHTAKFGATPRSKPLNRPSLKCRRSLSSRNSAA